MAENDTNTNSVASYTGSSSSNNHQAAGDVYLEAALSWLPLVLFLILIRVLSGRSLKKQAEIAETQKQGVQELQNLNKLLAASY